MYFWVGYVLPLWVEVTLHCLEIIVQHLHPRVLQGIELPSLVVVTSIVIGLVDSGGSGYCFSFALTSDFARLFVLLRLKQGLGTLSISVSMGLRVLLSDLVSKLGV